MLLVSYHYVRSKFNFCLNAKKHFLFLMILYFIICYAYQILMFSWIPVKYGTFLGVSSVKLKDNRKEKEKVCIIYVQLMMNCFKFQGFEFSTKYWTYFDFIFWEMCIFKTALQDSSNFWNFPCVCFWAKNPFLNFKLLCSPILHLFCLKFNLFSFFSFLFSCNFWLFSFVGSLIFYSFCNIFCGILVTWLLCISNFYVSV